MDYSNYQHPKFGRPLESKFINFKELKLSHARNVAINKKQLNEYKIVPELEFPVHDMTKGTHVGNANTTLGPMQIYRIYEINEDQQHMILYAFIREDLGPTRPLCQILFNYIENIGLLRKSMYCVAGFRGRGLISELTLCVTKMDDERIISDVHMTPSGEKAWEKLLRDYPAQTGIFHGPTQKVYPLQAANKIINNVFVLSPKDDNASDQYWFENPEHGQSWFYFINYHINTIQESSVNNSRYLGLIQPYYSFGDGYE